MQNLFDQLWELDKENSFARFTITPVKEGSETKLLCEQELWIKPYPNPFSYGGFWAQGVAKTTEEVDRLLAYFKSETEKWQKHGLVKIDIIRKPEMTIVEYQNDRRAEWLNRHGDDDKKAVAKVAQLSLM